MVVGILEVTLFMEGAASLKDKRRVIKSVIGRVRARFNAAASEVGEQDSVCRATLGFAVCGSDARILTSVLTRMENFVETNADAEVTDSHIECLNLG
ncbi:MAG: DUF503 domain-containing protein [Deltaproteobacteria bacterium]|jgi:uncharacterized protein YlxP (DUF503 family)|nr:DUF503 domain-containing protein [Deltaproteobacteria bacterium]